ncbi:MULTISPECIES: diacylglycerol/lipid kinase family protein [Chryseobacterium]|uniref:YegS/Rv2252/BmrU family lipid kinase n=1 Tax=Chryseobacterium cucumeris TaxID=1813611 RepID=A0ABX9XCZ1_9FLAO|nr:MULTISPECIES: YegS/Rv2252/BmrU family lipid kinase [Chryseobacterium]KYH08311.1 diacylglycerol kinase [Chryseobacterium cucumeris]MDH5034172.1 YegS/Rv2252/BmrU family lipid kinase [Chryseobacterium cucumeris]QWT88500.1 YegS/Rv2252/BmrU family lipid kinase [Chryseobacterium sp. PCH239]ROH95449.1 YegS/Rv2252/BmrU family lipid kinase [Chryseobacterium cucumeris]WFB70180.1 YegS/Rv2252/BmrU family lipid kinase [Chryseobacterium sp. WX]
MDKVAFIINPFSAKKNYQPFLNELKTKVNNPLYYVSESIPGTDEFIQSHFEEVDIFVAIGGDGTISTVAKNLIYTDKILAIFPAGSGNGFSNETQFSKNLDELLEKIKAKNSRKIDTFTVNDRLSINVSGTGFDGKVVKEFEKTSRGFKNYIKVSLKTFFNYKPIKVKFFDEEYQQYNGRYLMMNIANTRQFGNNAYIAPKASKSDGLVDMVLVKKFPLTYSALFAFRMFTKRLKDDEYVTYLPVSEISFKVNTKNWHLDGEFNKIKSPIHVKVQPASLSILI